MHNSAILTIILFHLCSCEVFLSKIKQPEVLISKCCQINEIYIGKYCVESNTTKWRPLFTSETGSTNLHINFKLKIGKPNCKNMQLWPIYHYHNSSDKLRLLPNGVLRHYVDDQIPNEFDIDPEFVDINSKIYHDYLPGSYCLDKKIDHFTSEFAWVCSPNSQQDWTTNEFLMHNIINPLTHGITIICLLTVAIIYFIMPTLRDLAGNIITTISICLIVSQTADLIRLLTVFKSHTSLLITEAVCYISLLGAFFWLNSLGYYIWKTFKSRNVFLRITDGKKYCYYGGYAWTCTVLLGILAMFAHFTMDYPEFNVPIEKAANEEIGSLGMIIFFVPIAFTVIMDVLFLATTLKTISKMHTYGRIHHKLRHSFRMFILLLLLMTTCWLFFLSSCSKYEGLINSHIVVNAFLGPAVFYICIVNQKHVLYLLRKTCCYENCVCTCCRAEPENEWGDEMSAMNTSPY